MMVFATLSFWLREAGIARSEITMLSWVGLMFGFKWVWAPLVDQIKLPFLYKKLGRRRSWLLVAQIGILISLVGLSLQNPTAGLTSLVGFALLLAFCAATQDIAIDAFRIECAPDDEQGILAASYMVGYRFAMILGSAGALSFAAFCSPYQTGYDLVAWQKTYRFIAAFAGVGIITCIVIKEPYRTVALPAKESLKRWMKRALANPFLDFFKRYKIQSILILGVIASYRISDIVMGVIANPFYVDMGYDKLEVAWVSKVFGIGMTIAGAGLGGILVSRFGVLRILFVGAILAAVTNLLFAGLATVGHSIPGLIIVITADNLSAGVASAAFVAFLSGLTSTTFSATQYALFSSLMAIIPKIVAGFSGFMVESWGYAQFFIFTTVLGIPTLVLLALYMKQLPAADSHVTKE